ncbi:unnamed protein product [Orchesella dallaii]|uniref:Uncharacterized protein n=1 Tax=Orchesella dallaii TaxID=48710 RepID=A0ABP1RIX5_9HEXA
MKECICGERRLRFQKTEEPFRSSDNLHKMYRQLQLIHLLILDAIAYILIPLHGVFSIIIVYCNTTLFRKWNEMDATTKGILMGWILTSCGAVFLILKGCGGFGEMSKKVLTSIKTKSK